MQDLKEVRDSNAAIREKNIPDRKTAQCKGPEAEIGLLCQRNRK